MQAEHDAPWKPQGEFGQADGNYLAWQRPRAPALAPFQNRLLAKATQNHGPERGCQDLAVVPLGKGTSSVSPALRPALLPGTGTAPRAARATTAAPSVPQNSPRRAVAEPCPVTGDALPPSF